MNNFITLREAAAILGLHRVYLLGLLRKGSIPGYQLKPRGKWFIDPAELDRFIRGNHSQVEAANK